MTEIPESTTKKKRDNIGAKATAKLGGGPTQRRTGRGGTTRRMTTNYGTTSQSQNRSDADIEFDDVRQEYRNMKPEPLYVFREKKDKEEEDPNLENADGASESAREGEESKDHSQKPNKAKVEQSFDKGVSDSQSMLNDSEDERAA